MATTVKELIDYLKTIPLDTELHVLVREEGDYWDRVNYAPMDLSELTGNVGYVNLADNPLVKPDSPEFDKRYLYFGEG